MRLTISRPRLLLLTAMACALLTGCFKDEPANSECDITTAWVHADDPSKMFFSLSDTLVNIASDKADIVFNVRAYSDLTALSPMFTTTPGAVVSPASGSTHDFSQGPVAYRVTSEDGAYGRDYRVSFVPETRVVDDTVCFDFEQYSLSGKYYTWTDPNPYCTWSSGNAGFAIARGSAKPEDYPTVPLTNGYEGAGVKLETRDTGPLGAMGGMRLAAGNLFLGDFDPTNAFSGALTATHMGVRFDRKPLVLTGFYTYQPGPAFQNKDGKTVADKTDSAAIYAVMYLNHDSVGADHTPAGNAITLDGSNIQSSDYIVGMARLSYVPPMGDWTWFMVPFDYTKDIDYELLRNYGYNIAVVFSSSKDGDYFQGAVGSTLCVDKVRLICEKPE